MSGCHHAICTADSGNQHRFRARAHHIHHTGMPVHPLKVRHSQQMLIDLSIFCDILEIWPEADRATIKYDSGHGLCGSKRRSFGQAFDNSAICSPAPSYESNGCDHSADIPLCTEVA